MKIYTNGDSLNISTYLIALIRQDPETGKVYGIRWRDTVERLLYDFNLSIGDTVRIWPADGSDGGDLVVDEIDTVKMGGVYRKRLLLYGIMGSGLHEYWIEGIGSTYGLLGSGRSGTYVTDIHYPYLQCYLEDDNIIYKDPYAKRCFIPLPSGMGQQSEQDTPEFYPNPTRGEVRIKGLVRTWECTVYDGQGEVVFFKKLNSSNDFLDIKHQPDGTYHIVVRSGREVRYGRVVKGG